MAFKWSDPVWAAEQRRKIAEAKARKKAEREMARDILGEAVPPNPLFTGEPAEYPDVTRPNDSREISIAEIDAPWIRQQVELNQRHLAGVQDDGALNLLRRLYAALRVRSAAGGWQAGRCMACNLPHPRSICPHQCPCHEVERYLAEVDSPQEMKRAEGG